MGRAIAADGIGTVARLARSVARRRRPTPRTSASWPPPASTRRPPTTSPPSSRSCSASRPKFGALVGLGPRRRARRHHRRALRHDRPARREDLEGERGRLRQPDQPRAGRGRHRHRHRQRHARSSPTDFTLGGIALGTIVAIVAYHLARALAPGRAASPGRRHAARGRRHGTTATATGSTTSTRTPGDRTATLTAAPTCGPPIQHRGPAPSPVANPCRCTPSLVPADRKAGSVR